MTKFVNQITAAATVDSGVNVSTLGEFKCAYPDGIDLEQRVRWANRVLNRRVVIDKRENQTSKDLASLVANRAKCRRVYAAYMASQDLPDYLRPYAFFNLTGVDYNVAEIIPRAYIAGWEQEPKPFFTKIVKDLMPDYAIGALVDACPNDRYRRQTGVISGYWYRLDKYTKRYILYYTLGVAWYTYYASGDVRLHK